MMVEVAETPKLREQLTLLCRTPLVADAKAYRSSVLDSSRSFVQKSDALRTIITEIVGPEESAFQISGVTAVVTSLASFLRAREDVLDCVAYANSLGGDTDTMATMAASISAALNRDSEQLDGDRNLFASRSVWPAWLPETMRNDVTEEGKGIALGGAKAIAKFVGNCTMETPTNPPYVQSLEDKVMFHLGVMVRPLRMNVNPSQLAGDVFRILAGGNSELTMPLSRLHPYVVPILARQHSNLVEAVEERIHLRCKPDDAVSLELWSEFFALP